MWFSDDVQVGGVFDYGRSDINQNHMSNDILVRIPPSTKDKKRKGEECKQLHSAEGTRHVPHFI